MSLLNSTPKPKICLEANVIFSAAFSETGGARMLFRLAEIQSIQILISSSVLSKADRALRRKAPDALGHLAVWLNEANCQAIDNAPWAEVEAWNEIVDYLPDAGVIAAAVVAEAEYLVTLDRQHILDNRRLVRTLPLPIGTPGDCLAWLRTALISPYDDSPHDTPATRGHQLNDPTALYQTRER